VKISAATALDSGQITAGAMPSISSIAGTSASAVTRKPPSM
jgi:hypothetical protein